MKTPLISVVVPAYNTLHTIGESLDSILAQTYKNFEIIVVDDGSPDDVAAFVEKKYAQKVKLIRQKNTGLAGARNTGINAAAGEYVAFLDSDDVWLPQKLEAQIKLIQLHPDGAVYYSNCYFWENGQRRQLWTDLHPQPQGDIARELIGQNHIPVLTTMVKRKVLLDVGMFDPALREVEDYDLWLRIAADGGKFYGTSEALALYRINPQGPSRNTLRMAQTQLKVYKKCQPLVPPDLKPLINRQITVYSHEVLHQQRRLELQNNRYPRAALLSVKMIRYRPTKALSLLATAILTLVFPDAMKRKLT